MVLRLRRWCVDRPRAPLGDGGDGRRRCGCTRRSPAASTGLTKGSARRMCSRGLRVVLALGRGLVPQVRREGRRCPSWLRNCSWMIVGWASRLLAGGRHAERYLSAQSRRRRRRCAADHARRRPVHALRSGPAGCPWGRGGGGGRGVVSGRFGGLRASRGSLDRGGRAGADFRIGGPAARSTRPGGAGQARRRRTIARARSGADPRRRLTDGPRTRRDDRGRGHFRRGQAGGPARPRGWSARRSGPTSRSDQGAGRARLPGPDWPAGARGAGYLFALATGSAGPAAAPPG